MRSKVGIGLIGVGTVLVLAGAGTFWLSQCCDLPIPLLDQSPTAMQAPSPETAASSAPHAVTPSSPQTATSSSPDTATPGSPQMAAATPQGGSLPASQGEATGNGSPADVAAAIDVNEN